MNHMSNNQWNNDQGQGEGQWQPQGDWNPAPQQSAGEWDQGQAQPTQDWNTGQPQQPAQDWNTGQQTQGWNAGTQPQQPTQDWNTGQQTQDWNAGAQSQQSAQDWNTGQQGWNAGATAHQQGWGDPHQQAGFAPGQPQWQPQPVKEKSAFSNVFDFSFKKFALPEARGTIFLVAVIAIGVNWLSNLISLLTYGFGAGMGVVGSIFGGLAMSVLYILLVRVFLEGMSALVSLSTKSPEKALDKDSGTVDEA